MSQACKMNKMGAMAKTSEAAIAALLNKITPPGLAGLQAYAPSGNIGAEYARLDAMESPYGFADLPAELQQQWLGKIKAAQVNRYPDQLSPAYEEQLGQMSSAAKLGAGSILLGNGSDELILLIMLLCGIARGGKLLSPAPSFSMYSHLTKAIGGEYIGFDLDQDAKRGFALDLAKFAQAIAEHKPQLIFIAQPNNPTGNLFPEEAVRLAAEANAANGLVVVDRAYDFFCPQQHISNQLDYSQHQNLIELRTLSKIGTAGLRFGFALGSPPVMAQLAKLRLPYNINTLTKISIEFLLDNLPWFQQRAGEVADLREELLKQLREIDSLQPFPSATNFVLFKTPDAAKCHKFLLARKIITKNFSDFHPLLKGCIRASIGRVEENQRLIEALKDYTKHNK